MNIKEHYEEKVPVYGMNKMRKKNILSLIPDSATSLLDIGCGSGELLEAVLQVRPQITERGGADISEIALQKAGSFATDTYCFDFESEWPESLTEKKYDVVVASEVIEHLFFPEKFFEQCKRVLSPGGVIIITTPNLLFWKNRLTMFFGKFEYTNGGLLDKGHVHFFTVSTLRKMVEGAGYQIEQEHNFYPNLYTRGLNWLGDIFPGLFTFQMIFKLKKHEQ
ncbi:MAG: class I SAM-dependent methyltransferase [Patescibacteria group bacterium]